MRPLALTAAAALTVAVLGCGGSDAAPAAPTDGSPAATSVPQVYFVQIDT